MDFNKLDKIVLTFDECMNIAQWVDAQNFESLDLTFQEGLVILKNIEFLNVNMEMGIYFKIDDNGVITIKQYDIKDKQCLVTAIIDEGFFLGGAFNKRNIDIEEKYRKQMGEERLNQSIKLCVKIIFDIFQYMNHYSENVVITEEKRGVLKTPNKKTSKNKRSNIVYVRNKKYTFVNTHNKTNTTYNRHIDVWSVKGHWRHYKDGKKVWVKPYKKGIGEIEEGKIYRL